MVAPHRSESTYEIPVVTANHRLLTASVTGVRNQVGSQIHIRLFLSELQHPDFRNRTAWYRIYETKDWCRSNN